MTDEFEWLTLEPDEEVVWSGQPRIQRIIGTAVGAVVFVALAAAAAAYATSNFRPLLAPLPLSPGLLAWGGVGLVVLWMSAQVAFAYLGVDHTDYVLTTHSIYYKYGIFSETVTSVGVDRVQNTTLSKDFTGNFFDYGTVTVSTAGSGGADLAISDVDDPESFRDRLQEQVRAAGGGVGGESAQVASALDDETVDALLDEARQLRAVAERMEERA